MDLLTFFLSEKNVCHCAGKLFHLLKQRWIGKQNDHHYDIFLLVLLTGQFCSNVWVSVPEGEHFPLLRCNESTETHLYT